MGSIEKLHISPQDIQFIVVVIWKWKSEQNDFILNNHKSLKVELKSSYKKSRLSCLKSVDVSQ